MEFENVHPVYRWTLLLSLSNSVHMAQTESLLAMHVCRQKGLKKFFSRVVCKFHEGGNEFVSFRRIQFDHRTIHSCTTRVCNFSRLFFQLLYMCFWSSHRLVVKNNILLLCPQNSGCGCFRSQI